MARLEIPSIVVHKGGRSESRPGSPVTICESVMPSLPAPSPQALVAAGPGGPGSEPDMLGEPSSDSSSGPASPQITRSASTGAVDAELRNYRNRANSKVKLLVRSHAMRESPSPPRGETPQNNGSPPQNNCSGQSSVEGEPTSSPRSARKAGQPVDNGKPLSPKQIAGTNNNNSEMVNNNNNNSNGVSNGGTGYSPRQTRNTATSPTCRTPSRNGSSSPSPVPQPKITNNQLSPKFDESGKRSRSLNAGTGTGHYKCNNCSGKVEHRPILLQTPVSPSKHKQTGGSGSPGNNNKSEQRRPNSLNVCTAGGQCNNAPGQCNTLSVVNSSGRSNNKHKLRHQNSSSQSGSYESASPCLSRDNSTELYTDSTGIDLEQFIAETINRNQKDRTVLLKIEKDLIEFARDKTKVSHKFPNMSSYNRMLVHRVAAYFGMEHNVDQSGLSVIITRTKNMRIPDMRFKEHIRDDLLEEPRRSILKRDSSSFEDSFRSPERMSGEYCRRSKSFEEREEEYEKARRRIFENSSGESGEVSSWPYWSSSESSDASARYRLLPPTDHCMRQNRLAKGESLDGRESYRSNGSRPSVSKSHSFGGYSEGLLARGDSVTSTHSAGPRLMKQDSGTSMCSRLSPSSSGYKSQSQRSDTTISPSPSPSPNMTCNHGPISSHDIGSPEPNSQTIVWAVTSISSVPAGSVIINPQNNQPYTNPDGSLYRFDPDNPPKLVIEDMDRRDSNHSAKHHHSESSDSQRTVVHGKQHYEYTGGKRRSQANKCNANNTPSITTSITSSTPPASPDHHLINTATSPSLPYTPPPAPPPPPPLPEMFQHHQHQNPPPVQPHQGAQSLVRTIAVPQPCNHGQTTQQPQQYTTYIPTSEAAFAQNVYPTAAPAPPYPNAPPQQQTVIMAPHPTQQQPAQPVIQPSGQDDPNNVFTQNPVYGNYTVPVQPHPVPPSGEVTDLTGYFMGMNVYDQRAAADNPLANNPYPQAPSVSNQPIANMQQMQPNYWQSPTNQLPPQQTMYFVQPPGAAISVNQNSAERQQCPQQQRFATSYAINLHTMTPPTQTNVSYNTMTTVTPSSPEYTGPPPVHMVPAYYPPAQPGIQPPIMYRVPTPPNTPTSGQIPSMQVMYMNSNNYPSPAMMNTGAFGQQVGPNGTAAPPGSFVTPTMVPNFVFRQNVPLVTGVRTSTPGNSQRTSRSPTPGHDFFGGGNADRNVQPPTRYPLPMYQGVHIVQGDMRLMHPGVPGNPRLQYAPVHSPPVMHGGPRPYRPPSNTSNSGTIAFEGKNPKFRKQRSKITTVPVTSRPNNQSPTKSLISSNAPKDLKEANSSEEGII